ncbi:atherin-like [Eptesicus fuscus]|uniref:atherin-like n=1 Tax=Eptesicus fuscus TaxID=29078 RepID=UPI00240487B8|nr:atherin-like [Eptesicus fuscus]
MVPKLCAWRTLLLPPADWAASEGSRAAAPLPAPGPPPAHRPGRAPGGRCGPGRGRRRRAGRAARGRARRSRAAAELFPPRSPARLGAGGTRRGGESGIPGRSSRRRCPTTWPPPPLLQPAPRAPFLLRRVTMDPTIHEALESFFMIGLHHCSVLLTPSH